MESTHQLGQNPHQLHHSALWCTTTDWSGPERSGAASSTRHCGCGLISFEIYDFELSASRTLPRSMSHETGV